MDYRAALVEFYQKHNPEKLPEVDLLLAKYRGREEDLLHALRVKYGAHKTAAPPQQQPPPPPKREEPPKPQQQAPPPPPREPEKKVEQPSAAKEESKPTERQTVNERHQPLSSSVDKGRTAAERAEYWRKELAKREEERRQQDKKPTEKQRTSKVIAKSKQEEYEPEEEFEEEEDSNGGSWFTTKKIVFIALAVVLIGAVLFVLLNDDLRTQISVAMGIADTEQPHPIDKKSGIDPDVVTMKVDSTPVKSSGDFALDDEEDEEEDAPPVKVEEVREKPAPKRDTQSEDVPNGLKRNYWYLSYMAVTQEGAAKKIVRQLQSDGYDNAGYYYIPDYDPRGKRFYKIYIGPFANIQAAERALDNYLVKKSPGTYAYLLK